MHKDKNDTGFFWALDGFRGIAAICVVVYHYSINLSILGHDPSKRLVPDSFLAVDFFFVLSGFIIAHAYHARLANGLGLIDFMRSRLIRLYPLYFISITIHIVMFIMTLATGHADHSGKKVLLSYILHLFFLPTPPQLTPIGWGVFPLDFAAWSLSLEIGINIMYALCNKRLSPAGLIGLIILSAIGWYIVAIHYGTMNIGFRWDNYWGGWLRVSFSFFTGILLYTCYRRYNLPPMPSWLTLVMVASMIAIFCFPEGQLLIPFISSFILFPAIVWLGAHIPLSGISRSIAAWLGKISYAVYITHFVTYEIIEAIYAKLGIAPASNINANIAIWTIVAVLFAWLLDEIYDIPVRRWLKKNWVSKKARPAFASQPAL